MGTTCAPALQGEEVWQPGQSFFGLQGLLPMQASSWPKDRVWGQGKPSNASWDIVASFRGQVTSGAARKSPWPWSAMVVKEEPQTSTRCRATPGLDLLTHVNKPCLVIGAVMFPPL